MDDLSIYKTIKEYINNGQTLILATVVETKGSTPRSIGAKMIVLLENKYMGTIGGGNVEAKVREESGKILAQFNEQNNSQTTFLIEANLAGLPGEKNIDVCGGSMKVLLELLKLKEVTRTL